MGFRLRQVLVAVLALKLLNLSASRAAQQHDGTVLAMIARSTGSANFIHLITLSLRTPLLAGTRWGSRAAFAETAYLQKMSAERNADLVSLDRRRRPPDEKGEVASPTFHRLVRRGHKIGHTAQTGT
jgi:hypothetical protein